MAGYIGKSQGVTQVDGYNRSEADAEFVQTAGDTMTGALAAPSATITDVFFPATGYSQWKQTNFLGDLYLNNGTDRFKIDASGRVTMPYQPAFNARLSSTNVYSAGTVIYNSVLSNVGGHYNTSNGRFTAPVSGHYQFNVLMTGASNETRITLRIEVNGVIIFNLSDQIGTVLSAQELSSALSTTVFLNQNDFVQVTSVLNLRGDIPATNSFSGFLIG